MDREVATSAPVRLQPVATPLQAISLVSKVASPSVWSSSLDSAEPFLSMDRHSSAERPGRLMLQSGKSTSHMVREVGNSVSSSDLLHGA